MYNAYLIDDEPLVLADMEKNIPWQEFDLAVAGKATDPLTAHREIGRIRPEVVFTDIKMPNISGLDLISSLRSEGHECEFVVISAHESFGFARQVIQNGGFDYLIKPVGEEQYTELLERLLCRLRKKYPRGNLPSTSSGEFNQIIQHLNRTLTEKHTLGETAAAFNLSAGYLCSLFAKHLDTTFSAYMRGIRMEAAAQMLLGTEKPIKAIAAETGYEDYFYFCRVFRDYYSRTPTQYRRDGRSSE